VRCDWYDLQTTKLMHCPRWVCGAIVCMAICSSACSRGAVASHGHGTSRRFLCDESSFAGAKLRVIGNVTDVHARPVAGASVTLVDRLGYRRTCWGLSSADGSFSFDAPPGRYLVTATADGLVGGAVRVENAFPRALNVTVALLAAGAVEVSRFSGQIRDVDGRVLPRVLLRAARWDDLAGETFYFSADDTGQFDVLLPRGMNYELQVDDPRYVSVLHAPVDSEHVALTALERKKIEKATPGETIQALRQLSSGISDDGAPTDSEKIAAAIRDVVVVGLGESTHGTHELFELRAGLIRHLVARHGFTTVALEGGWAETSLANEYVAGRTDDARAALAEIGYWPWDTVEMRGLLDWLRAYNREQPPGGGVEFVGIDVSSPGLAARKLLAHLTAVDPQRSRAAEEVLRPLAEAESWASYAGHPAAVRQRVAAFLAETAADIERAHWPPRYASDRWSAIHNARMLDHFADEASLGRAPWQDRDHAMAESILSLRSLGDRTRRIVIWAHNGHITRGRPEGAATLGSYLAEALGDDYAAWGFAFHSGLFRTLSLERRRIALYRAPAPPPHFYEADLFRIDREPFWIDLRSAVDNAATHSWATRPRPMRLYGAVEISERYPWPPVPLSELFDAIVFVDRSTPTVALGGK
jgi:erythromycin esterase